ncbi:TrbI/VirB10 family protein [Nostoc parmelioides]|uniref:Uncharacterized protein n=1 Tax=Nostoc parmelioides FACHB-3921 TaxID=2692909 RepID=A0ABR8BPB4_9NOSO|nr:TrbI/VirB10 family protein [Nostoc parmelioides]MBD2254740.1 hypothetical protein [Nostoc parmelioides FACHB-3921]
MNHNPLTVDEIINLDDEQEKLDDKLPPIDEKQNLTEHNLITSPWSRIGIIGVPLGIGFLVFYFLFNNIINGKQTANNADQNEQNSTQATGQSNNSDGDVYAQLALAKQQEQLEKLNQNKEKTPAPVQNSSTQELKPVAKQTQGVQVSSAPPQPRIYSSPSTTYSPQSRTNSSSPRTYSTYSVPQSNLVAASTPAPDPIAEIERLRSIGSFGQVVYGSNGGNDDNQIITTAKADIDTQTNVNTGQPLSQTDDEQALSTNEETVEDTGIEKIRSRWSSVKSNTKNYLPEESQIIQGRKAQYLVVGQMASGVLVTPLIKEQSDRNPNGNATPDDPRRYVAKLTGELKDNHGQIAIPDGSLLAIELVSVDGANHANAQVRSIILNNTEYSIKPGAITVLGDNSQPLIARKFHDRGGDIARGDLTVGVVSALSKVGEVINQPESEEEIEDEFTGRIRRRSSGNRRNLTGALLEGAFGSMSSILGERARSSTEEIQSRPNIWYIPASTRVTFLVNRTLEMEEP